MCSVLLVIALTIISFILASDSVKDLILAPDLAKDTTLWTICGHNAFFNTEAHTKACKSQGAPIVAFVQEEAGNFDHTAAEQDTSPASSTSFQRPSIPRPDRKRDGEQTQRSMALQTMQTYMLRQARILCFMWPAMEPMLGPRLCPSSTPTSNQERPMATEQLDHGRGLAIHSVDTVTTSPTVSQKEITQTTVSTADASVKRTRQRQDHSRPKLWTAILACCASCGTAMVDINHSLNAIWGQPSFHAAIAPGIEGRSREGQANQVPCSCFEEAQGRTSTRPPKLGQGSNGPQWTGRNEAAPLGCYTARPCEKRSPGLSIGTATHASSLEELSCTIGQAVVFLHRAISSTGKAAPGPTQECTRCAHSSKTEPRRVQKCSRTRRRRSHDQRCRRDRLQGDSGNCRPQNRSQLPGFGYKPGESPHTSRTSRANGGRARSAPEAAQNVRSRKTRRRLRWCQSAEFWGARVNTITTRIAQGLPRSHAFRGNFVDDSSLQVPPDSGSFCSVFDPARKWLHSILHEPDFVDEWTAMDKAFHLSIHVLHSNEITHCPSQQIQKSQLSSLRAKNRSRLPDRNISFCPDVDLYIGSDDAWFFHCIQVPDESLRLYPKPWSLQPVPIGLTGGNSGLFDKCEAVCRSQSHRSHLKPSHVSTVAETSTAGYRRSPVWIEKMPRPTKTSAKCCNLHTHTSHSRSHRTRTKPSCEAVTFPGTNDRHHASAPQFASLLHWSQTSPIADPVLQPMTPAVLIESKDSILCKHNVADRTNSLSSSIATSSLTHDDRGRDPTSVEFRSPITPLHGFGRIAPLNGPCFPSNQSRASQTSVPPNSCHDMRPVLMSSDALYNHATNTTSPRDALPQHRCRELDYTTLADQLYSSSRAHKAPSGRLPAFEAFASAAIFPDIDSSIDLSPKSVRSHITTKPDSCSHLPCHAAKTSCQQLAQVSLQLSDSLSAYTPVSHFRLDHESPIAGIPFDANEASDDEDDDVPDAPAPDPAFVRRLIERFSRLGHNVHDRDFEIAVRTWFIDHVNMRRCSAFRILQLVGPPHLWEQQFTSLWVDLISPDEWFDLHVVQPDPPRPPRHSFVALDVIITQSLHMDRFPGLVTVFPAVGNDFAMFAVAYSFADFISGQDIVDAADATRLCRYRECTITFGWDEIPHTLRQHHIMRPGDGFQIMARPPAAQTPISSASGASSSTSRPMDVSQASLFTGSGPTMPWWDDPVHGRFTTPLHLFQLDAHEVTVELVNAQLAQPSHDISAATGVPFQCLEAVHVLLDRPLDFPEMAIPAILQRTGDIPCRSTDRLILIDVVYHHHSSLPQSPGRPTVVRTVHRIDYEVIRPQLLMAAAVYHYCDHFHDICEVVLDRIPWPLSDHAPRPVRHGSYARIVIPPPPGYDVDTRHAVNVLHNNATTDEIMQMLTEDLDPDEESLLQQVATIGTVTSATARKIERLLRPYPLPHDLDAEDSANALCLQNQGRFTPEMTSQSEHCTASPMHPVQPPSAIDVDFRPKTVAADITPKTSSGGQPTLHHFFMPGKRPQSQPMQTPVLQHKCSEAQEQAPPTFTTATPAMNPNPPPRQRPIWQFELFTIFDELARVTFPETGPTMTVSVWYVHHVQHPMCLAPRQVELDNIQDLWYADLCNAWWDRIIRQQPLKVIIVKPTPDNQLNPRSQTHLILEQGYTPDKAAIIFTAVFLSNFRNGVFQRAESVDMQISAQYMIDRHQFNAFCDFRPCTMFSGVMRFHRFEREDIFSGISVHLVVGPPPSCQHASGSTASASSSAVHHDDPDHLALMQRRTRWNRNRPAASAAQTSADRAPEVPQPERAVIAPPVHFPPLHVPDLREFRNTLQWTLQRNLADTCQTDHPGPAQIQTWFLDSFRVTRSDTPRTVLLRPWPHTWTPDILARWQDTIDHSKPVHLHVVQPTPTQATNDIKAHVLLVQTPNPLWRAILMSITYFDRDPWNHDHLALMVDVETTVRQLSFIADVNHPANPMNDRLQVEARHASITLDSRSPFHVRDGYHFDLIVYDVPDPWNDGIALFQVSFRTIHAKMRRFHHHLSELARTCMLGPDSTDAQVQVPISLTQNPRNDPPTNGWDSLPFHGYMQALWQPLALLSPNPRQTGVRVITWYLDHVRYPQSFEPRHVRLTEDPTQWLRQLRRPWFDVILPHEPLHFHVVQPAPPDMDPDVAAHILLVQQPLFEFRSSLITLFDSAFIGNHVDRFASMVPMQLTFSTLVGLAYRDIDCQDPTNVCDAWIGNEELPPHEARPVMNGHSLVVAVHRPIPPGEPDDNAWQDFHVTPSTMPSTSSRRHQGRSPRPTLTQIAPAQGCNDALPVKPVQPPMPSTLNKRTSPLVPIALEHCLPNRPTHDSYHDDRSTMLWFTNPNWQNEVAQSLHNTLHHVPHDLLLPEPTCAGILASVVEAFDPAAHPVYEIYIDGATGATHAGWAAVVVADTHGSRRLLGITGGTVDLCPEDANWIGANCPDNIAAELTAVVAAQAIALQSDSSSQFCIRPDLTLSRILSQESATTKAHPRLAQLARLTAQWNQGRVTYKEVRGHAGDPWNELADAVAKYCVDRDRAAHFHFEFAELHLLALEKHDVAWDWLNYEHPSLWACMPPCLEGTVVQVPPCPMPDPVDNKVPMQHETPRQFALSVATINVLALEHTEHHTEIGRKHGGRTARIDAQFHAADVHVIGLQETRTAKGRFQSDHYHILASGCQTTSAAQLGCELWLHKHIPIATDSEGTPLLLSDGRIAVQIADPRRLTARIDFSHCSCIFAVLHAPCMQKSQGDGHHPIDKIRDGGLPPPTFSGH